MTRFLRADDCWLETLARARFEEAPSDIVDTLARVVKERARAVAVVERKRAELEKCMQQNYYG